jgi:hypothetical protein
MRLRWGRASLRVFCAHLVFVFVGLRLLVRNVDDDAGSRSGQLHRISAILPLAATFTALIHLVLHDVRQRRAKRGKVAA